MGLKQLLGILSLDSCSDGWCAALVTGEVCALKNGTQTERKRERGTGNELGQRPFCLSLSLLSIYFSPKEPFLPLLKVSAGCLLPGTPFPKNFLPVVKKILSRLFRVFVHVYIHHFDRITQMGSEAHVNTCYKHFYYFVKEFNLIDTKELEPLVGVWVGWGSGWRWRGLRPGGVAWCPGALGDTGLPKLQLPVSPRAWEGEVFSSTPSPAIWILIHRPLSCLSLWQKEMTSRMCH